jgi:hypothetical protein
MANDLPAIANGSTRVELWEGSPDAASLLGFRLVLERHGLQKTL